MGSVQPRPSGVERTFGTDELIVSKTDTKGVITYANHTFRRISGYSEAELVGRPHNIIRHPDMPRCMFKLMWDRISAGRELFAYLKNLAADGAHYWVYAHVTPTFGPQGTIVGYHSNRRCPDRPAVDAVDAVYQELRAEEDRHPRPADAIAASAARLQEHLAAAELTYDRWVWQLTAVAGRR